MRPSRPRPKRTYFKVSSSPRSIIRTNEAEIDKDAVDRIILDMKKRLFDLIGERKLQEADIMSVEFKVMKKIRPVHKKEL
mgnify:CR=1 FL=1